jgi:hypothetical protein
VRSADATASTDAIARRERRAVTACGCSSVGFARRLQAADSNASYF